ncbi:uncharacterized protein LOC123720326 [Pieris brassicae]|uniref:uncharacterized protein LOC123720326 n=1 Tax=Pieris brassicae TaxID=7116 RepID=UPI001E65F502|nr:uncharacterized protein LOC123720326 [Pieris brassicae]
MSSEVFDEEDKTEVIFETNMEQSSEEDPPMEQWSSLILEAPEENKKKILYGKGLYDPGSGEVCAKYISMSQSSVLRHPYYNYPAVLDPGITAALLLPEAPLIYPGDGQELYLALCDEMDQCPVKSFHRGLLTNSIDLRYYCVNPFGVRPMALALQYNKHVTSINFTDNFLNEDACFHLGEMLICNSTLHELNLSGCRIGPKGAKQLCVGLILNKNLRILNLNQNEIGDAGLEHFANVVIRGIGLLQISLSKNNISGKSLLTLAESLETHNKFSHIDLSKNNLYSPPNGIVNFLGQLGGNKLLEELNLSWNALSGVRIAGAIKSAMRAPNLKILNISNNRFNGEASENLIGNLTRAKKLMTYNLSYNPFTPEDALLILTKLKSTAVKVQNVMLDNIFVNGAFLVLLDQIKAMKSKKNLVVAYGGVVSAFKLKGPDMRDLVLNRAEYLTKKPKKQTDIALIILQIHKDVGCKEIIQAKAFQEAIEGTDAPIDSDLIDEIVNAFPGPKGKTKLINLGQLIDFINRKWPERKLPPTPPPEPEPEPEPEPLPQEPETKNSKSKNKNK